MVAGLGAALEAPQIPPEARERIRVFLDLYQAAISHLDSMRPDLFVHRLIERIGLRRQLLFAGSTEVAHRLLNLAKFGELAGAYVRRSPQATAREFSQSIASVAEAGIREAEAVSARERRSGVQILGMRAAKGVEFEHVFVMGLSAKQFPSIQPLRHQPIPDPLLKETLPQTGEQSREEAMRRLLYVSMTRAKSRVVFSYPINWNNQSPQQPSPLIEKAREAINGEWKEKTEELFGPSESLQSTFQALRDDLLATVSQVGNRLGELRFDTDLDVSHAVVRYLELLKISSLIDQAATDRQSIAEALPEINARLKHVVTPEQREIFESSPLDEYLLTAERDERLRARAVASRSEPSLEPFLPRRGEGLQLSASDIDTYLRCPLKYKFARVFRIPSEPTINQRFGILMHQVLERFHDATSADHSIEEMLTLLETAWRRGGFGESEEERQFHAKALKACARYHERFKSEESEPVWFERPFHYKLGVHHLRGRVDRVDRLPDGRYELIDYKTGRPHTPAQLEQDIQLSIYALGARNAWEIETAVQSYYYVLDDQKVPVEFGEEQRAWITETVAEVGDGIQSQSFEPTPSPTACSMCDYRIACPAAER
jgi:DNA helicase-2/ATP-dependent DNA helicase PcrA